MTSLLRSMDADPAPDRHYRTNLRSEPAKMMPMSLLAIVALAQAATAQTAMKSIPRAASVKQTKPARQSSSQPAPVARGQEPMPTIRQQPRIRAVTLTSPKSVMPQPTVAERKLARCRAEEGRWILEVKGDRMSGSGSDVDEIYGTITVLAANLGMRVPNWTNLSPRPGGQTFDLWHTAKNRNIGKYDATDFSTVRFSMEGKTPRYSSNNGNVASLDDHYTIIVRLWDEDDGRGGGNDERFTIDKRVSGKEYEFSTKTHPTSCEESPEFDRRATKLAPLLSNDDNVLNLTVSAHWYRLYPDIR